MPQLRYLGSLAAFSGDFNMGRVKMEPSPPAALSSTWMSGRVREGGSWGELCSDSSWLEAEAVLHLASPTSWPGEADWVPLTPRLSSGNSNPEDPTPRLNFAPLSPIVKLENSVRASSPGETRRPLKVEGNSGVLWGDSTQNPQSLNRWVPETPGWPVGGWGSGTEPTNRTGKLSECGWGARHPAFSGVLTSRCSHRASCH